MLELSFVFFFFFQAEDGIRDYKVTGVQTCALPIWRLFISFRDTTRVSATKGDWVGWVGRYEDIVAGREGQYRVRIMHNTKAADCAYPGVEVLPDGTIVTTTYGHWIKGELPYIVSVRFTLADLDAKLKSGVRKPD